MSETVAKFRDITIRNISGSMLDSETAPPEAFDAVAAAYDSVEAVLSIADQAGESLGYWRQQHADGLVPREGAQNQQRQIRAKADELNRAATRNFGQAVEQARSAVIGAAFPQVPQDREHLARGEFDVALGDATGSSAKARILGLAKGGSAEAVSVLNTTYARQVLLSAQVADADAVLAEARQLVVSTDGLAADNLARLDNLEQAGLAAQSAYNHAFDEPAPSPEEA